MKKQLHQRLRSYVRLGLALALCLGVGLALWPTSAQAGVPYTNVATVGGREKLPRVGQSLENAYSEATGGSTPASVYVRGGGSRRYNNVWYEGNTSLFRLTYFWVWSVNPSYPASTHQAWEIQLRGPQTNTTYPDAAHGIAYAELCARVQQTLQSGVSMTPGKQHPDNIYFQIAHAAKNNTTSANTNRMQIHYGASSGAFTGPPASSLVVTLASRSKSWTYYRRMLPFAIKYSSTPNFWLVYENSDSPAEGNFFDDIQTLAPAELNLQQRISNSDGVRVEEQRVNKGDILTIRFQAYNFGNCNAGECRFQDILHGGYKYVEGSVRENGVDAPTLATYNNSTQLLHINYGVGARSGTAASNGGVVYGECDTLYPRAFTSYSRTFSFQVEVVGDVGKVPNQGRTSYNDHGFQSLTVGSPLTARTRYAFVEGKGSDTIGKSTLTVNTSVASNYIASVYIADRQVAGKAWVDRNRNGNIDAEERLLAGSTVRLVNSTNGALVQDVDGNDCITTVAADGTYAFDRIPKGIYRVEMDMPQGYEATNRGQSGFTVYNEGNPPNAGMTASSRTPADVPQGSPHNNAIDGTSAVTSGAVATTAAFSLNDNVTNKYGYYAFHLDLGITPKVTATKKLYEGYNEEPLEDGGVVAPGDLLRYDIVLTNHGIDPQDVVMLRNSGIPWMIRDTLPDGVTLNAAVPLEGMTYLAPSTVQWSPRDLTPGSHTFTIWCTAGSTPCMIQNSADIDVNKGTTSHIESDEAYIAGRIISGLVWKDTDDNGMIGAAGVEPPQGGMALRLLASDGTVVAQTTTNASGAYSFLVQDADTYQVELTLPNGYNLPAQVGAVNIGTNSASAQSTPHNNALQSGRRAAISIPLTGPFSKSAYGYYASHADFGLVPGITVSKLAYVDNSTEAAEPGAQVAPGTPIRYEITITNMTGASISANHAVVVDPLPEGFVFEGTSPTGVYTPASGSTPATVTWNSATIGEGETVFQVMGHAGNTPGIISNTSTLEIENRNPISSDPVELEITAYTLTLTKTVTGSNGDPTQDFVFSLLFLDKDGNALTSAPAYEGGSGITGVDAPGSGTLPGGMGIIRLRHGQQVTVKNLPKEVQYQIEETAVTGYTTTATITNENPGTSSNTGTVAGARATGQLKSDNCTVAYTNNRADVVPTGAWLDALPFALVALGGLLWLGIALWRRGSKEEGAARK